MFEKQNKDYPFMRNTYRKENKRGPIDNTNVLKM